MGKSGVTAKDFYITEDVDIQVLLLTGSQSFKFSFLCLLTCVQQSWGKEDEKIYKQFQGSQESLR